ncbi:SAC3/GANP family protein [Aphelenchoides fujianensis]|nr:SAC3/GANP family protein [Aphelenchoides fujianensis]
MPIVGLCEEKCLRKEGDFRIKNGLLHPLECRQPFTPMPAHKREAVVERLCKTFSRPAANQTIKPEDVRTPAALLASAAYLQGVKEEFRQPVGWPLVYEFLVDRFRSIRQEITIQQLREKSIGELVEAMIRFYVRAQLKSERAKMSTYDAVLHRRELEDCFSVWLRFDEKSEESAAFSLLRTERANFRPRVFAVLWRLFAALANGNYVLFFRSFDQLESPLQKTNFAKTAAEMRLGGLTAVAAAFRAPNCTIPLDALQSWFGFEEEEDLHACLEQLFETSPVQDGTVKFHGVKQKPLETASLGHSWRGFRGSRTAFQ